MPGFERIITRSVADPEGVAAIVLDRVHRVVRLLEQRLVVVLALWIEDGNADTQGHPQFDIAQRQRQARRFQHLLGDKLDIRAKVNFP